MAPSGQFLRSLLSTLEVNKYTNTNLHDIIQYADERVAILDKGIIILPPRHRKTRTTYFWSVLYLGHLDLILTTVFRIVRKGLCRSPHGFSPEHLTLCSEAPDEDTLISLAWTPLST
jgi:hypothetical protein